MFHPHDAHTPGLLLRNYRPGHPNGAVYTLEGFLCGGRALRLQRVDCAGASGQLILPRIRVQSSPGRAAFTIQRTQFPIRHAYAATVNKSQGSSLDRVGIFGYDFFEHGMLYSAVGRSTTFGGLFCDARPPCKPYGYVKYKSYAELLC